MKKRGGILPVSVVTSVSSFLNLPQSPLDRNTSTSSSSSSSNDSSENDIESPKRRRTVLSIEQTKFRRDYSISSCSSSNNCSDTDDDDNDNDDHHKQQHHNTYRFDTDVVSQHHHHHHHHHHQQQQQQQHPYNRCDLDANSTHSDRSLKPVDLLLSVATPTLRTKAMQLGIGVVGIYSSFLYYGLVHEDLYRYVGPTGERFTLVWSHQILESFLAAWIGYVGRMYWTAGATLASKTTTTVATSYSTLTPFVQMGLTQLAAKTLISLSLEVGVSYPVLTVAKAAKIVPVMMGQFILGGSSYTLRDYIFALLIVAGTTLLSAGQYSSMSTTTPATSHGHSDASTITGLALIFLSLSADGLTGGIQKKLQRTAAPTAYDLLYYSHLTQLIVATVCCIVVGEIWTVPAFFHANPAVLWFFLASSVSTAVGQCFIFYIISHFDPLICTTITTTRKMLTVLLSISFKGHDLTKVGSVGLALACTALLIELEGKISSYRTNHRCSSMQHRCADR